MDSSRGAHFSYNKLWKLLIDRDIKKKKLQEMSGVSAASIAKLGRGENVTTDILLKICEALDCDISDITEVIKADSTSGAQKGKLSL